MKALHFRSNAVHYGSHLVTTGTAVLWDSAKQEFVLRPIIGRMGVRIFIGRERLGNAEGCVMELVLRIRSQLTKFKANLP